MSTAAARRHLEQLAAAPRPAGSAAETAARRYCADILSELGFDVVEEAFEYSTVPGRWATPAAGAMSIAVIGIASWLGFMGRPAAAFFAMGSSLLVGGVVGLWLARRGVLDLPLGRQRGINVRATRGGSAPAVWLVAHLDSKSQPVPTAARAAGIVGTVAVWIIAMAVAGAQMTDAAVGGWWGWIFVAAAAAALPVVASVVGPHSPGALDNASGVATVLEAATRLSPAVRIGVLLTSAEELGLAGARAVARRHPAAIALNCDGVDDRGTLVCMRRPGGSARSVAALVSAASRMGVPMIVRGLVPGLLVDAVALQDAGWDCATLSRGNWSTLARVHRPHDDLHHLTGVGVDEAATVLVAAVQQLYPNFTP